MPKVVKCAAVICLYLTHGCAAFDADFTISDDAGVSADTFTAHVDSGADASSDAPTVETSVDAGVDAVVAPEAGNVDSGTAREASVDAAVDSGPVLLCCSITQVNGNNEDCSPGHVAACVTFADCSPAVGGTCYAWPSCASESSCCPTGCCNGVVQACE